MKVLSSSHVSSEIILKRKKGIQLSLSALRVAVCTDTETLQISTHIAGGGHFLVLFYSTWDPLTCETSVSLL